MKTDPRPEVEAVWEPLSPKDLGTCAPPRAPDHLATSCMLCSARFSLIRARQHCRACGRIVCALCCTRWVVLPYLIPPVPDLEQPSVGDGPDTVKTTSQNSPVSNLTVAGPPVFQRSYSSPERYSRVCELCYGILARCKFVTSLINISLRGSILLLWFLLRNFIFLQFRWAVCDFYLE